MPTGLSWNFLSSNQLINETIYLIRCYFNVSLICFAFNGYFLHSLIDIDECSASIPVCDVNAKCRNTRGSYLCSCKAGFTGDGKTCAGEIILKANVFAGDNAISVET